MITDAAIAMNRFGLGARPNMGSPSDPRRWLKDQLEKFDPAPAMLAAQPSRAEIAAGFREYQVDRRDRRMERKEAAMAADEGMSPDGAAKAGKFVNILRVQYAAAADARTDVAIASETAFAERLVHFWANHFAISIDKPPVLALAGDYEFTAIRPHIMGKFSDLLNVAVTHPAMLLYLDQAQSIGPNSPLAARVAARRNKELGLNENLAREILELHTLGVRSVYNQNDVTEFARALTGHTVGGMARGPMRRLMARNGQDGEMHFLPRCMSQGSAR